MLGRVEHEKSFITIGRRLLLDHDLHCLPFCQNLFELFLYFPNKMPVCLNLSRVFGVSDKVRHKQGCKATKDGLRLEISDLGSRGIALSK